MGQNHVRIYSEMEGVKLAGISDVDLERVEAMATQFNTKPFTDYKEMFAEGLDAVSVVVPTKLHKQVVLDALEAGLHVLVEKPIADSIDNADLVIEAVHDIDIISYLYGKKVNQVYTVAGADIHSFEDHASIILRLDHEFAGVVETNWLTPHKVRRLTAIGINGVAYLDYIDQTVEIHDHGWIRQAKVVQSEPLKNELEHFIECATTGKAPKTCGEDGKHALEVAMAAIRSYEEERLIKI